MNGNGSGNGRRRRREVEEMDKGLIWKLPQLKFKEVGKVGPAFGLGAGCGLGFGIGLVGGIFITIFPQFTFVFRFLTFKKISFPALENYHFVRPFRILRALADQSTMRNGLTETRTKFATSIKPNSLGLDFSNSFSRNDLLANNFLSRTPIYLCMYVCI